LNPEKRKQKVFDLLFSFVRESAEEHGPKCNGGTPHEKKFFIVI